MTGFPEKAYNHEKTRHVFAALLTMLPPDSREMWERRWSEALRAERTMSEYNARWSESLRGMARFGQGGG